MKTRLLRMRMLGVGLAEKLNWFPPLLARLTLGIVFLQSGWGKLHNIPKVIEFFTTLGIPAPGFQAHMVATTEFVCGGLLVLGLLTRLASIPLAVTMVIAVLTAKRADIQEPTDLLAISEYLYLLLLVWLTIAGAGAISMDHRLMRSLQPAFAKR